jgi:Icc-related predicted phosphoesterase
MRLFFATDLHASDVCFRKFLHAARFYEADVLILGGDICGKYIVPYWRDAGGWTVQSGGDGPQTGLDDDQLAAAIKLVRDRAGYAHEISPDELAELDEMRLQELFDQLSFESIARWVALAEERLAGSGVRCLISPGNDDPPIIDSLLDSSDLVENPEGRYVELGDGWGMVTCGIANRTPWASPRELDDAALLDVLNDVADQAPDPSRTVFNFHVPPHGTALDVAPLLDEDLKPVVKGGEIQTTHIGSAAVRRVIEERRPLLGLHGHVHESRATARLHKSLCINPGSEYSRGSLMGAVVELGGRKGVKSYQLTHG